MKNSSARLIKILFPCLDCRNKRCNCPGGTYCNGKNGRCEPVF